MALTQNQIKAIKYFYCEQGLNMHEVASQVNVSSGTVKKVVDKNKLIRGETNLFKKDNPGFVNKGRRDGYVFLDAESDYIASLPKRQALEGKVLDTSLTIWERVNYIIERGVTQYTKFDKDGNPISFEIALGLRELKTASEVMEKLGSLIGLGVKFQMNFQAIMQEFNSKNKDNGVELSTEVKNIIARISEQTGEKILINEQV